VIPGIPPYRAAKGVGGIPVSHDVPNPFIPRVDSATHGLANTVAFLRHMDSDRAGPWPYPPVTFEMTSDRLTMNGARVGFVPVGGEVRFESKAATPQMIRGRGAAFFSFALPDPDRPRIRTFDRPGRVELSSGAGQFWAQADLFVCEHPYYGVTNDRGEFELPNVPPGRYELVVWHRSWWPVRQERDPDTGMVARMTFADPVETVQSVTVEPGQTVVANATFGLSSFPVPQPATK
jgi:hypothetical protein